MIDSLVDAGRPVKVCCRLLGEQSYPSPIVPNDGIRPEQTIYNWRNPEIIDTGQKPGLSPIESAELAAARRRIAELESGLAIATRSTELLKSVVLPKGGSKRSK